MAVAHVAETTAQNKTAGTTWQFTPGIAAAIGETLVVAVACDESAGAITLTDSAGNTYVEAGTGVVSAGNVELHLFTADVTATFSTSATITVDFAGSSITAKAATVDVFSGLDTTPFDAAVSDTGTIASNGNTTSLALTGVASGSLVYAVLGLEGLLANFDLTADTDTTDGTWSAADEVGTSGGSNASNIAAYRQYKITTGTSDQTHNTTASNVLASVDWAGYIAELSASAGGAEVTGTAAGSYTFTATGAGVREVDGTGAGTFTFTGAGNGTRETTATADATLAFTGTAAGTRATDGTATAAFGITATGAGAVTTEGAGTGDYTLTATAVGTRHVLAVAAAPFTVAATGVGLRIVAAVATGVYAFTATGAAATTGDPFPLDVTVEETGFTKTIREAGYRAALTESGFVVTAGEN